MGWNLAGFFLIEVVMCSTTRLLKSMYRVKLILFKWTEYSELFGIYNGKHVDKGLFLGAMRNILLSKPFALLCTQSMPKEGLLSQQRKFSLPTHLAAHTSFLPEGFLV